MSVPNGNGIFQSLRGTDYAFDESTQNIPSTKTSDVESVQLFSKIKGIIVDPFISNMKNINHYYHNGEKEKAAASLRATVDETKALKHHFDLIGPSGRAISASDASDSELMKDVSDAQLAEFIKFDVLEQLQGHAEKLAQVIDDTLPTLKKIHAKRVKKETRHSEQTTKHFQHYSLHFDFDYHQNVHNLLKQHKPGDRSSSIFHQFKSPPTFQNTETSSWQSTNFVKKLWERKCAPRNVIMATGNAIAIIYFLVSRI
jgi:hypothetical protein